MKRSNRLLVILLLALFAYPYLALLIGRLVG
jgi:hypothetical protein